MNLSKDCLTKIVSTFHSCKNLNHSYVLSSDTKLVAYKAKESSIAESSKKSRDIHTIELIFYDFEISKFSVLKNALSTSTQYWTTIDLSRCYIGDESCNISYKSLSNCMSSIATLNLYSNGLTPSSANKIANLLQYCIIEQLVLSHSMISQDNI